MAGRVVEVAVRRLLDHNSAEMTIRYATIKDRRCAASGTASSSASTSAASSSPIPPVHRSRTPLGPRRTSDAPSRRFRTGTAGCQQTCPHPNACLTCDSFLTTGEFLPAHRDQLSRTEQLIDAAVGEGTSAWST
ncbi:MAG: hypothetical protein ACR2ML_12295 [Solirubrobacteraceae bacterium]